MYVNIRTSNTAPSLKRKRAVIGDNLNIKVKNKALEQLKKVLRRIDDGRNLIQGIGPHLIIGCLIRSILRNAIRDNYLKMHVDMNSCTECMICVRNCPTKSIYIKDKSFLFSNSCESCMRCYNNCPVHAISNRKL